MPSTLTVSQAGKLLRDVIKDYNFWGQSESDAPLAIKTSKTFLDDKRILSLDASARKKLGEVTKEFLATRQIISQNFEETFQQQVSRILSILESQNQNSVVDIAAITTEAQELEFYTQLYSIFKQLDEVKMIQVDAPSDANVSLFICGNASDGMIYAQSLLVQT
jgi:hypothetical protein